MRQCISSLWTSIKANDSVRGEVLCNILIEFGIPLKLVGVIKVCLNESYSRARVGNHLSDKVPIENSLKQGDALLPLLFSFALEYVVGRVQVNQGGLKLNGTLQLLVYADDFNKLGGIVHTTEKNTEALVVASMLIGFIVNANIAKYMAMSRDQNAGQCRNIKIDHSYSEWVEEYNIWGNLNG
jgi:hypothetical protein